jgi:MFS family permease
VTSPAAAVADQSTSPSRLVTLPFVAVTASMLLFFLYVGMALVAIPRFVEFELNGGEIGIGLAVASFAIAAIAVRPFVGRLSDQYGRRSLMTAGALLTAASGALAGFAPNLPVFLAFRVMTGLGEAAIFVAAATLIADLSPEGRRAEGASYLSIAVYTGIGVGPVIGEWVLADDRYKLLFALASLFAVAAAVVSRLIPGRVDRKAPRSDTKAPLFHRAAIAPGLVLMCTLASFSAFGAFIPDHARSVGLSGAGGLFLVYSSMTLLLRLVGARLPDALGAHPMVTFALLFMAAGMFVLALVPTIWGLWVAAVLVGIAMAFNYPPLMAAVIDAVPESERAVAVGSFTAFFEIGSVAGGLILGTVAEFYGKRGGFAVAAVIALGGLVMLWTMLPRRPIQRPLAR